MKLEEIEQSLRTCERRPQISSLLIEESLRHAGSMANLEKQTGIRRQSMTMWLRKAVTPSLQKVRVILSWLQKQTNYSHEYTRG